MSYKMSSWFFPVSIGFIRHASLNGLHGATLVQTVKIECWIILTNRISIVRWSNPLDDALTIIRAHLSKATWCESSGEEVHLAIIIMTLCIKRRTKMMQMENRRTMMMMIWWTLEYSMYRVKASKGLCHVLGLSLKPLNKMIIEIITRLAIASEIWWIPYLNIRNELTTQLKPITFLRLNYKISKIKCLR